MIANRSIVELLPVLALGLVLVPTLVDAQEPAMPGIDQGLRIDLKPGQTLTMTTSFACSNENRIDVYLHRTGQLVICSKSHAGFGAPTAGTFAYKNESDGLQTVIVASFHKRTPPRGNEPWHLSAQHFFRNEATIARIGWEDESDNDYNDAMADIVISP